MNTLYTDQVSCFHKKLFEIFLYIHHLIILIATVCVSKNLKRHHYSIMYNGN